MPFRALLLASVGLAVLVAPAGAQLLTVDHPGQYTQEDIARGGLFYNANCFQCHGRDGDQISGIDLRRGLFRRSQSDEDLAQTITRGTPGGMPPFKLDPAELTAIVAFIRAGFDTSASVRVGDAARGRTLFQGKGECMMCHRVAGKGPRSAPDLSDIGIARAPAVLERVVREPSSALLPINRPVRIVMRDGKTYPGPPVERGHAHRADHRRAGAARLCRQERRAVHGRREGVGDAGVRREADRQRDRRCRRISADAPQAVSSRR